ncbi:MAG: SDR family oxidoreductase [Gemmatimonadaceae bacterium]|nr:SDR family oxidoreductase [Gemmatimonadaceae bacterium]
MSAEPKVVVITGASSGIGAEVARTLGAAGHSLVLAARREQELRLVAAAAGSSTLPVATDVTDRASVNRLRDEAIRTFGRIDVWINNAGRGITRPVLELTDEDFDEMMRVNVKSVLYGMQAVVPYFIDRGRGHLINVSSFLGRVPVASIRSAYNAAKAAVNALTANLRVDLRAKHPEVHVSLVMPGIVTTDFARNALGGIAPFPPPGVVSGATPGAMKPQTAPEVAAVIAQLIANPVAEVYTNPASAAIARKYYEDVAAFEAARGA